MTKDSFLTLVKLFKNPRLQLIVIDGDDTLWYDSRYYRGIEKLLVRGAKGVGVKSRDLFDLLSRTNKHHPAGEYGFAAAVRETTTALNMRPKHITDIWRELDLFLNHPIELLPGVRDGLPLLGKYRRVLLTKGREEEQRRKLAQSNLVRFFDEIHISEKKDTQLLRDIIGPLGFNGDEVLVIGNSIKHDIIPAIENGAAATWINHAENIHGRNGKLPPAAYEVKGWDIIILALEEVLVAQKRGECSNRCL